MEQSLQTVELFNHSELEEILTAHFQHDVAEEVKIEAKELTGVKIVKALKKLRNLRGRQEEEKERTEERVVRRFPEFLMPLKYQRFLYIPERRNLQQIATVLALILRC